MPRRSADWDDVSTYRGSSDRDDVSISPAHRPPLPGFGEIGRIVGLVDQRVAALAESLRLKPALRSVARMRAESVLSNRQYRALQEKTLNLGLRRADFPDH
jgi:hypothetical protein